MSKPDKPVEGRFETFLRALVRVPKDEVDRLESDRPKKQKPKKPAA